MTPGEMLSVLAKHRGWSQAHLAEVLGRPPQVVSEIVTGKKRVTGSTAVQLEAEDPEMATGEVRDLGVGAAIPGQVDVTTEIARLRAMYPPTPRRERS